ncbi:MAG: hypothetical protein WCH82_10540 [Mycobacteriaceae bacterium]
MTATDDAVNEGVYESVGVPPGRYIATGASRARYRLTYGLLVLGLGVAMTVLSFWDRAVTDASTYACPPDCGRPPNAVPVANLPKFVAPGEAFSVNYPPADAAYDVTEQDNGVTARMKAGSGGVLRLFSEPASGRVARQVVRQILDKSYPNADIAYELPNSHVGYQYGYGVVADFQPAGVATNYQLRMIIVAAVKNDLALIAVAEGPFRRFTPDFGPGPPSGANLEIAIDMGKYLESFRWKGDPPR